MRGGNANGINGSDLDRSFGSRLGGSSHQRQRQRRRRWQRSIGVGNGTGDGADSRN